MKRTCVFASYDKEGIINSYVISFLKYLREVADEIIFVSDCSFSLKELNKIRNYVSYSLCEPHGEYDFGSYKRGIQYLLEKEKGTIKTDELILCNDSCFCINSLDNVFKSMSENKCDFWSMTSSNTPKRHLQSFFLVIRKNMINSECFLSFLNNIKKQRTVLDIINCYEVPFLSEMESSGFKGDSFILTTEDNPTFFPITLINQGSPLVKKKIFSEPKYSKQSLLKLGCVIKKINRECYYEILNYYGKKSIFFIWLKLVVYAFLTKVYNVKFYKVDYFSSGNVRYRFLGIPFFFKIRKK